MSTVQGLKALEVATKKYGRAAKAGLRAGLYNAGLFLQRESQMIVPIDTGDLRRSANTRPDGDDVVVSYGTDYGIYVHEDLEAQHKPGKEAKFLEKPLREKRGRIAEIVRDSVRRAT